MMCYINGHIYFTLPLIRTSDIRTIHLYAHRESGPVLNEVILMLTNFTDRHQQ